MEIQGTFRGNRGAKKIFNMEVFMVKFIKTTFLVFSFLFLIIASAQASTMTLEFTNLWIDHNDTLIIDGNSKTLQWYYHGSYSPVGLWNVSFENQVQPHVKITNDGITLVNADWKIWTTMPSIGTTAYSSTFDIPFIPLTYYSLSEDHSGREPVTFNKTGYPVMTVTFYDGGYGAANYTSTITINYTPVPVPPSLLLLAPGFIGIAAMKRRIKK
jgi:hypothetical protein